jgi:hypothetical protein
METIAPILAMTVVAGMVCITVCLTCKKKKPIKETSSETNLVDMVPTQTQDAGQYA